MSDKPSATIIKMPAPKDGRVIDPRLEEASIIVNSYLFKHKSHDECFHINTQIDEELEGVTCRDCGKQLSMFWVLKRMAEQETKWSKKRDEIIKETEIYESRKRCKCEKCGEITKINRNSPIR